MQHCCADCGPDYAGVGTQVETDYKAMPPPVGNTGFQFSSGSVFDWEIREIRPTALWAQSPVSHRLLLPPPALCGSLSCLKMAVELSCALEMYTPRGCRYEFAYVVLIYLCTAVGLHILLYEPAEPFWTVFEYTRVCFPDSPM